MATAYYLRYGRIPAEVRDILATTTSLEASQKFNPNHDELGRFTFAPGVRDPTYDQPPTGRDPSAVEVVRRDAGAILNPYERNSALLKPRGVRLSNNIEIGRSLHNLPSMFADTTTSRFLLPEKEAHMMKLFWRGQSMDYQRIYGNGGKFNRR